MEQGQQKTRAYIVPKQSKSTMPVELTWDQFLRITDLFTASQAKFFSWYRGTMHRT